MTEYLLAASGLQKSFGRTPALRNADIGVLAGEIVAVMGPSGSGKSTLLHCLAGVLTPDAGSVQYDGQDVSELSDGPRSKLRRTEFGFVFQFGQLIPELTVEENVALPCLLGRGSRREVMQSARSWLDRFGLAIRFRSRPGQLSGGEAQRVAVARAMMIEPRVIFADEPTGSLDSVASSDVMDLLTDAARERGTAVVLVTHETRTAAYADREIVVRDGTTTSTTTLATQVQS